MALSQLRLNQITGSAPNNFKPAGITQGVTAQAVAFPDLSGSLGYFAQALTNIHGNVEFGAQVPGRIQFAGANNIEILGSRGAGGAQSAKMEVHDGSNASGLTFLLDSTGNAADAKVKVTNVGGEGAGSAGANAAIQIGAVAGGYAIQSGLTSGVAGVVEVSDGATLRLGEASGDTCIDITPTNAGASEKIKIQNTTGNSSEAIKINALAGSIDVDAQLDVSVEAAAGSITIGSTVADGQAVNLGKPGATEIILAPNGTAANEKISIINTSGIADDAIKIDSVAGGLLLAAGDDSLHIDADGTDTDALNIDSAGGMDVDVAGVLDIDAGDDSRISVTTSGKNLTVSAAGGGAQVLTMTSAGTGTGALAIAATAGGIDVDAAAAVDILAGTTMTIKGTGVSKYGDDTGTLDFDGAGAVVTTGVTTLDLQASGLTKLDSSGGQIRIGSDADNQDITIAAAGTRQVLVGSPTMTLGKVAGGRLQLSGSSVVGQGVTMSGSVVFSADGSMTSGGDQKGMLFGTHAEFATFRSKSLFNANTTVVGALTALASSVASTEPTLLEKKITNADGAAGVVAPGAPIQLAVVAGDTSDLTGHARHKIALYYNGQKMLSGSAADFTADNCDYRIVGDGSSRSINLNFHTAIGDLIQIMDFQ